MKSCTTTTISRRNNPKFDGSVQFLSIFSDWIRLDANMVKHGQVGGVLPQIQSGVFLQGSKTGQFWGSSMIVEGVFYRFWGSFGLIESWGALAPSRRTMSGWMTENWFRFIKAIITGLHQAIARCKAGKFADRLETHKRVKSMYFWPDVARRTENVYLDVLKIPSASRSTRLRRYVTHCGPMFGIFFMFLATIDAFLVFIWSLFDRQIRQ